MATLQDKALQWRTLRLPPNSRWVESSVEEPDEALFVYRATQAIHFYRSILSQNYIPVNNKNREKSVESVMMRGTRPLFSPLFLLTLLSEGELYTQLPNHAPTHVPLPVVLSSHFAW